ncbi:hypothetical protein WJX72_004375 [[Myrmecia] bisecta]|uniref:Sperm-tail PG-rich repeat-containing protein 2 n=1 Tax=[Myrmecia] bisecta TaxID=41462 RepID=A0AAW1QQ73_9CHLO
MCQGEPSTRVPTSVTSRAGALLDEDGKALHGVPGPGSYPQPSSFSRHSERRGERDAGEQIFHTPPAYSISGRWHAPEKVHLSSEMDKFQGTGVSPGPAYDVEAGYKLLERGQATTGFGTANREGEQLRYVSRAHVGNRQGADSPGPAAYRRAAESTLSPSPACVFGTGHATDENRPGMTSPGPVYRVSATVGPAAAKEPAYRRAPEYSFAPLGERRRGLRRRKSEANKLYISAEHANTEPNLFDAKYMPGPGAYQVKDPRLSKFKADPAFKFPQSRRMNVVGANKELVTLEHALSVPDPDALQGSFATFTSTLRSHGAKFGPPPRQVALLPHALSTVPLTVATDPNLMPDDRSQSDGSSFTADLEELRYSPGPGAYDVYSAFAKEARQKKSPTIKFGTSTRECNSPLKTNQRSDSPGPGSYNAQDCAVNRKTASPAFSIAPNLRTDFTSSPHKDEPGPGEYPALDWQQMSRWDSRRQAAPRCTFAAAALSRDSYIPRSPAGDGGASRDASPSPAQDAHKEAAAKPSRGVSFGMRPTRRAHDAPYSGCFPSGGQGKGLSGRDSPGPQYDVRERDRKGAASPSLRSRGPSWGPSPERGGQRSTASAGRMMRGEGTLAFHPKVDLNEDLPGPGSHDPLPGIQQLSNHKKSGAFSFGTSQRPPLATVRF